MALSWNEIRERAVSFSKEWERTANEEADAKPFLEAFLNIFGISSKRVSTFEHWVKKLDDRDGYIDLLMNWTKPLTRLTSSNPLPVRLSVWNFCLSCMRSIRPGCLLKINKKDKS